MKQAAEITFVQLKHRTLQTIIYPPEKNLLEQEAFGTHEVLVVCCLPTPFIARVVRKFSSRRLSCQSKHPVQGYFI